MKTIGIFSTFWNFDPAYSLCSVVKEQLIAHIKHGYKPILFVLTNFKDEDKVPVGTEIRKVIPQLLLEAYKDFSYPDYWKDDAEKVKQACIENMADIDYLICHDIFFIDTYLPYNIGLRESLKFIKCNVLAWTHSAPSQRPELKDNIHANRYTLPLKTKLIYLNHEKANDLAEMYGAWLKDVRIIHNSRDPRAFWNLDEFVVSLIDKYDLLDADITSVYPLSTPRMITGKGLDKAIKIHSKLKQLGYKTRLIVPNAHANADKEKRLIANTQLFASDLGLDHTELIFTSLEGQQYELGVSNKIVSDLFRLSNIFIFPTHSENCSLVLLEAMMSGNLLVLNKDVLSLSEFGGEKAIYMDFKFRSDTEENERYYLDLAKIISSQFENDKSLQIKRSALKKFNYDNIFKQIERLYYENN